MFIARWHITANFGHTKECISILRRWEIDVGQRIGWKSGSIHISTGFIGASQSDIEFETRFDSLSDFESALADMQKVPHHGDLMAKLHPLVVGGTNRWVLRAEAEVQQ